MLKFDKRSIICYNETMIDVFKRALYYWNDEKNQRAKLQQAYFATIILLVMAAGLTTLFSPTLGQHIMILAAGLAAMYLVNAVAWALLDGLLIRKLDVVKRTDRRKK